ncbi:pilin [Marinobacterium rhizophilum]|uniref:pilin n=1 Tax=Marinobacterium rhizophilum TaxID=420402 RepID=UPI00272C0AC5|nr:pilin [Marinobacterium rhizophilum]
MNRSIKMVQKGFTLIELMIVVAIIGILAALAIPAYQDYVARSQASEALTITDGLKVAIQEHYATEGVCPYNSAAIPNYNIDIEAGIDGSYVASVGVRPNSSSASLCEMIVFYEATGVAAKVRGQSLVIVGDMNAGTEVDWTCNNQPAGTTAGTLPVQYPEVTPSACKL